MLENFSNPEVKAWSDAENSYTRKYLDSLSQRPACYEEIRKLVNKPQPAITACSGGEAGGSR